MFVETSFDAGHEGFEVVLEMNDAGSGGSDCGNDSMLACILTYSEHFRRNEGNSLCAISRSSRG